MMLLHLEPKPKWTLPANSADTAAVFSIIILFSFDEEGPPRYLNEKLSIQISKVLDFLFFMIHKTLSY